MKLIDITVFLIKLPFLIIFKFIEFATRKLFTIEVTIMWFIKYLVGILFVCYVWDLFTFVPLGFRESFVPTIITLANIKQNNLTLKALQEKLDKLEKANKKSNNNNKNDQNKDSEITEGKENIIVRIRKGGLPHYFIISTLLTYANKIPIINRFTSYIKKRYAKTSWLMLLIYFRKFFIVINAIIGVLTVFLHTIF